MNSRQHETCDIWKLQRNTDSSGGSLPVMRTG